jgi:hypothetical protein
LPGGQTLQISPTHKREGNGKRPKIPLSMDFFEDLVQADGWDQQKFSEIKLKNWNGRLED